MDSFRDEGKKKKGNSEERRHSSFFFISAYQCGNPRSATVASGTKYDEFDKIVEMLPRVSREPCKYSFTRKRDATRVPRNSQLLPFIFIIALPFVFLIGFAHVLLTFSVPWDPVFLDKN